MAKTPSVGDQRSRTIPRMMRSLSKTARILSPHFGPMQMLHQYIALDEARRFFPGVHHHASFDVEESVESLSVEMTSDDGETHVSIRGTVTENFPETSSTTTRVSRQSR